jgi:pilus assembly protein CpaE
VRQLATPHETGLHLLAAPADAVEAAAIDDEIMSRVLTLARRAYDYVIVDSFPLLDRVMIAALDLSDRTYVVLESVVPTVLGIARYLKLLENLGLPKEPQRIVLNRYTGSSDNLKPADVALRLGRDIDHVLAYQKKVAIAANLGQPYILGTSRLWGLGRALHQIVDEIEAGPWVRRPVSPRRDAPPSANGSAGAPEVLPHEQ